MPCSLHSMPHFTHVPHPAFGRTEVEFTGKVASPNPQVHANFLSKLVWAWLDRFVKRGANEDLVNGDFFFVRSGRTDTHTSAIFLHRHIPDTAAVQIATRGLQ